MKIEGHAGQTSRYDTTRSIRVLDENRNSTRRRVRGEMRELKDTGTTLKQWLVRKHGEIKVVRKIGNDNNTSNKKTVTKQKLDQRIKLRRQYHNKQKLMLKGWCSRKGK